MHERIAITGLGLINALGHDVETGWDALLAGEQRLQDWQHPGTRELEPLKCCRVTADLKALLGGAGWRHHPPAALMACLSGREGLRQAGWLPERQRPASDFGVAIGYAPNAYPQDMLDALTQQNIKLSNPYSFLNFSVNSLAAQITIDQQIQGFAITLSSGYLAGLESMEYAMAALRSERVGVMMAGGVEAIGLELVKSAALDYLGPESTGKDATLHSPRAGQILAGEGCGWMVLEKESAARQRNARVLALISGLGMGFESAGTGQGLGQALDRAVHQACQQAGIGVKEIGMVFLSANGNPRQDTWERESLLRIFDNRLPPSTAIKAALGETFHAGGAMAGVVAVRSLQTGNLPPTQAINSEQAQALNLSGAARTVAAQHALIISLDHDQKAAAMILSRADVKVQG